MKIIVLAYTSKTYNGHSIKIDRPDLTRKMSCMETWVPRIESLGHEVIFFDGSNVEQSFDKRNRLLHLVSDESYDYHSLQEQNKGSLMLERLKEGVQWCLDNREFDYILRLDDGTYINAYVIDKIYAQLKDVDVLKTSGGGSGMFFSKKACLELVQFKNESKIHIEDLAIFSFLSRSGLSVRTSDILSYQYVLSEKFFTIHYTNGKRQYFVDDVISYYYKGLPIKRKVVLNYHIDHTSPMKVNSWDSDFEVTPIYYAFDKDLYNWEHYGEIARSNYTVVASCPFAPNSIHELFLYDVKFDFSKQNEKIAFFNYVKSVMKDGFIYLYYKDNNYDASYLIEHLKVLSIKNEIDLDIEFIKGEKGLLIKTMKRDSIVVAQFWTSNLSYGKFTYALNDKYCKEKGYTYHVEMDYDTIHKGREDRAFTWYKPRFLLEVFKKYNPEYIMFMDADAAVSDNSYTIEEFIDPDYDIIATEDHGPSTINAGVIIFKNTEWTKDFLNKWWDSGYKYPQYKDYFWWDQTGFGLVMQDIPDVKSKIKVISNRKLNWREHSDGNFIFHAFGYGHIPNRTIDALYYERFNTQLSDDDSTLCKLGKLYPTDKDYFHKYFEKVYEAELLPYKNNSKLVVELGIETGNSLRIWKQYFKCDVIGLDKEDRWCNQQIKGCKLYKCDQGIASDLEGISQTINNADIIIDDGSHRMHHQQPTFAILFKALRPGGLFVIEDLHTSQYCKTPENDPYKQEWGDASKTTTLEMLEIFQQTGKIKSDYLTEEQCKYLEDNIKECRVYEIEKYKSITSIIIKK